MNFGGKLAGAFFGYLLTGGITFETGQKYSKYFLKRFFLY
jgi:hypothetical protein